MVDRYIHKSVHCDNNQYGDYYEINYNLDRNFNYIEIFNKYSDLLMFKDSIGCWREIARDKDGNILTYNSGKI